jgi:uncharacterized YccA/Bax inhibitor family protein
MLSLYIKAMKGVIFMNLKHLISPLGMLTGIFFGIAILNFFVKYVNKTFINKLKSDKNDFKNIYRKFMRLIVKYHKILGTLALIFLVLHFYVSYSSGRLKSTGILAGIIMLVVVLLGFYGFYINKNMRGAWLKVHRVLAFVLLAAVALHVL